MATKDPEKRKAIKKHYLERLKIAKYGPQAAGVNMSGRHGHHAKGPANGRWAGGRFHHSDGYVGVKVPIGHHLRQAHGYAYEHALVAEEMLGRCLAPDEVVHHKNGKRDDNRPENLSVETRSVHEKEHAAVVDARDNFGRFAPTVSRLRDPKGGDPAGA